MADGQWNVGNRTIIITGAARGIGLDAATRLVHAGGKVVMVDRKAEQLEAAARSLGPHALSVVADVAEQGDVDAVIDAALRWRGGIDAVVANAGISGPLTPLLHTSMAEIERVIAVNLLGACRTIQTALPHVVERRGYVLGTCSLAAFLPVVLCGPYNAGKAGLENYCRTLRIELAHTGTQVGVAYFGRIATDMATEGLLTPYGQKMEQSQPKWLAGNGLPVSAAGAAIAQGVTHRRRRVLAPRWLSLPLAFRGLLGPADELMARSKLIVETLTHDTSTSSSPTPE